MANSRTELLPEIVTPEPAPLIVMFVPALPLM